MPCILSLMGEPKELGNLQSSLSVRVNHLRFINGMTQKELALRLGMGGSTLGHKINGLGKWGLEDAIALASIFNVTIDYLIGNEPIESANPTTQASPAAEPAGDAMWARRGSNPRPAD